MKKLIQVTKIDEEKLKQALLSAPTGLSPSLRQISQNVHIFNMDYDPNKIGGYKTPDKYPMKVPDTEMANMEKAVEYIGAEWKEVGNPVYA